MTPPRIGGIVASGVTRSSSSVTTDGPPIRVVFADDSYLVREAITHVLTEDPRIALVAVCEDGESLRAAIEAEHPDVV